MKRQQVEIRESVLDKFLGSKITSIVAIVTATVGVIMFLLGPSMTNKTALLLQEERIKAQRATIDELAKTQQNDTQEVKSEVKAMRTEIGELETQISNLATIINERIPAKK